MAKLLSYRRVKHGRQTKMKVLAEDLAHSPILNKLPKAQFNALVALMCAGTMAAVYVAGEPDRRALVSGWSARAIASVGKAIASVREGCHPGYLPCLPIGRDVDCADRIGPVLVIGPDEYQLDGDRDLIGCE